MDWEDVHMVLASTSPRRYELMKSLGIPFEVVAPEVDEGMSPSAMPVQVVEMLAQRKAEAVAQRVAWPPTKKLLVVGSDTVVVRDGKILGKPLHQQEAVQMLTSLVGRWHEVYSGLAVLRLAQEGKERRFEKKVGHSRTRVRMRSMERLEIERYVRTGEPLDKAGAYAIQGLGATIVEEIAGDYFNVVGLPLPLFSQYLREWDYTLF